MLVFLANIIIFLKRLIVAFFVSLVYRPGRYILRLIFHQVIVKLYSGYLSFLKKIGWSGFRENSLAFLFDQKLVHVMVVIFSVLMIFYNLTASSKAQAVDATGGKTILEGLVQSEFGTQEEQQLIEEFFDQEATISPTQQKYLDNLSAVREQPIADSDVDSQDEFSAGQDVPGVVKQDYSDVGQTQRLRKEIITYSVEAGNTVSTIAEKFGISVNTILWANNLSAYSLIRPGDNLTILPTSGIMHQVTSGQTLAAIANKFSIDANVITEFNELKSDQLAIGQKLIIPGGKKEIYAAPSSQSRSGLAVLKDLITGKTKMPEDRKVFSGNKMAWPTVGYRITQYFTWRHFAVDIANKVGTPLYAADSGVIETAGWGRGYGNQVVINHGGGKLTRYAHQSKILVHVGQQVKKGQVIGLMGSTGWSTGSHLHFEVIINGAKKNPLNYIR